MYKVRDIIKVVVENKGGNVGEVGIVVKTKANAEDCLVRYKSGLEYYEFQPYVVVRSEMVKDVLGVEQYE